MTPQTDLAMLLLGVVLVLGPVGLLAWAARAR
jgi:hypothetical protein